MTDPQSEILEKVFYEFGKIIEDYYPELNIRSSGYEGPEFHFDLSRKFKDYKETPYYYKDPLEFVHWTSLHNLSSIINNREIRLYDLTNSEDIQEFNYAAELLDLSNQQIASIKQNYFTASFCNIDELNNPYLWSNYGKKYKGVAIHFAIEGNIDDWETFLISKVYYELPPKFKDFQTEINVLKQKYNNGPKFNFDLWRFAGFYKKPSFNEEKEVRLACTFPFKSIAEQFKYVRKELKIEPDRNRIVSYIPLKLWTDPNSSHLKALDIDPKMYSDLGYSRPNLPKLRIKAIYFGNQCGLSKQEYWQMHYQLKELFEWRLGYSIEFPLNLFEGE